MFRVMSTRVVAFYDESNRHHDKNRVRFDSIFKKIRLHQENRPGNDSNGFGKLMGHSFQEKYETMCAGSILGSNGHFSMRPPGENDEIMEFFWIYAKNRHFDDILRKSRKIQEFSMVKWSFSTKHDRSPQ